jgi:dsRNA-specific ribonuclease
VGRGEGQTKKKAEQRAADEALAFLKSAPDNGGTASVDRDQR